MNRCKTKRIYITQKTETNKLTQMIFSSNNSNNVYFNKLNKLCAKFSDNLDIK